MNTLNPDNTRISSAIEAFDTPHSYVDWGAILAGTVIASAITLVLTGFGSAIGLSLASPFSGKGISATALGIAGALWIIWVAVTSLIAGSYVTGRMRRRAGDANSHEVNIRDGAHGLVVWAVSAILGAMLAASSIAGIAKTGAEIAKTGTSAAITAMANTSDYDVDMLVRNDGSATAADDQTREQIGRILLRSVSDGQLNPQDKAYLSRLVSTRVGVDQAEADRRINAYETQAKAAAERTRKAAETARRVGILVAFLTAASMALAGAAAWWGASLGGKHRDENTDLSHLTRW